MSRCTTRSPLWRCISPATTCARARALLERVVGGRGARGGQVPAPLPVARIGGDHLPAGPSYTARSVQLARIWHTQREREGLASSTPSRMPPHETAHGPPHDINSPPGPSCCCPPPSCAPPRPAQTAPPALPAVAHLPQAHTPAQHKQPPPPTWRASSATNGSGMPCPGRVLAAARSTSSRLPPSQYSITMMMAPLSKKAWWYFTMLGWLAPCSVRSSVMTCGVGRGGVGWGQQES